MDDLLAELEKTNADLAKKLRQAHSSALDEQKGLIAAAEKKAKAAEAAAAKLKADVDSSGKTVEEATAAARKERDEAKAALEKAGADLSSYKLRTALERKLGISDEAWSRRATDALLTDFGEGLSLDDKGKLVGAEKAIEKFKAAEPKWFETTFEPPKVTTPRAGSAPTPGKVVGSATTKTPQTRAEKIAAHKASMAPASKKKGE
jgi:hypothetical protein